MPKGNQINLGEKGGIDTDEVQAWKKCLDDEEVPTTIVGMKNTAVLHLTNDAKVAFDAWAGSLRPVAEAGRRELCATCGFRNLHFECKHDAEGAMYPECFEDEDA